MNIKEYTKIFGFPIKFYKENGEEVVFLFLDEKEEDDFLDKLVEVEKKVLRTH